MGIEDKFILSQLHGRERLKKCVFNYEFFPTNRKTNRDLQYLSFYIYYVRKLSDLIFFLLRNPGNFNDARLHEATFDLHTCARIFSRLSIASVDGKQHLSKVVFSVLLGFSLQGK